MHGPSDTADNSDGFKTRALAGSILVLSNRRVEAMIMAQAKPWDAMLELHDEELTRSTYIHITHGQFQKEDNIFSFSKLSIDITFFFLLFGPSNHHLI